MEEVHVLWTIDDMDGCFHHGNIKTVKNTEISKQHAAFQDIFSRHTHTV